MFRAVVFDLDNTLYPERSYREAAFWNVCVRLGRHFGWEVRETHGRLMRIVREQGENGAFERLLVSYRVSDDLATECMGRIVVPAYTTCACHLELYEDARVVLQTLRERKVPMGLVTNGRKDTQWNKIRLLGIRDFFDCIIVAGEHFSSDRWKPHSAPFEMCFSQLGLEPRDCLYVGDNPELDIAGAVSLGATVLLVSRDGGVHTDVSDCVPIGNLTRITEWLQ